MTLNKKILEIFSDNTSTDYAGEDGDGFGYDSIDETSAADAIEKLILQEKIDLLNKEFKYDLEQNPEVHFKGPKRIDYLYISMRQFLNKITELTTQLNQLNKQL